jgi:hypothetical protein
MKVEIRTSEIKDGGPTRRGLIDSLSLVIDYLYFMFLVL